MKHVFLFSVKLLSGNFTFILIDFFFNSCRFPILIRECSGIHPKLWVRYGFGREASVDISGKTADEVYMEIAKL